MKNISVILLIFALFIFNNSFAQEYNFEKDAYKFIKAADHELDIRLSQYDVGFYFLDLELDNTSVDVAGNVRIDLDLNASYANELVFDFKDGMQVDSIKVNGVLKTYTHANNLIVVNYTHEIDFSPNYQVSAQIYYHGTPSDGMFNQWEFYNSQIFQFTYSLSEPYLAKYWFPCKQELTDKADSSYFYVTIPDNLKAGSNGLLTNEYSIGSGKKRMEWQSSYPIDFYLISISVANYQDYSFIAELSEFGQPVLVQNYIPNNADYLTDNGWYIDRTEIMLDTLSHLLGIYPFHAEKYGHCITPLGGGMEHQTMTTLGNFDFRLIIHELAHSWFGDYLTCSTWQDIWINEGFASYGEYFGEQYIQGPSYALGWLNECQGLAKESPTGSVYVPFEQISSVNRVFDYSLTYRKGACLVHMIRYMFNDDVLFFATIQQYLALYGNTTATAEDLKTVLEAASDLDFDPFFAEWYYGEGFPNYSVEWWQSGNSLQLESTQTTSAPATTLFTTPMEFKIIYDDDTEFITRQDYTSNFQSYTIPVDKQVVSVVPNPNLAVLADVSSIQKIKEQNIPDGFQVYPNPSNGEIKLFTDSEQEYKIELFDLNSKLLYSQMHTGYFQKLDFSMFEAGIYIVKVSKSHNTYIKRIVLN
jgi:aminopeptidase N